MSGYLPFSDENESNLKYLITNTQKKNKRRGKKKRKKKGDQKLRILYLDVLSWI